MKKRLILGLFLSLTTLSWQHVFAETTSAVPGALQNKSTIQNKSTTQNTTNSSWLGVWIEKPSSALSKHLSSILKDAQGLIIKEVSPGSPADKAGLLEDDIIVKVDDTNISSEKQLVEIIGKTQAGTRVNLAIIRQGKLMTQEATVEASPHRPVQHNASNYFPHTWNHNSMGMNSRPPQAFQQHNWMNDPFFNHRYDRDIFRQQFNRMQQQLYQLQQQQQQLFQNQKQQLPQHNSWSQFESIQIESTGDKQRAVVKYNDASGNKKEFVFEGNMNDLRQQISAQKEMDEDKKQNLLQALDLNMSPPDNFNQRFPMPYMPHH